jgi:hypothetical protein
MPRPCDCCSRIHRPDPPNDDQPGEARYRWVSPNTGNVNDLCVRCCALWRENAVEDPDLAPERITEISA